MDIQQEPKKPEKWYFKTSTFVIAVLSVGPFALPLLWFNPRYSTKSKVIISIIVLVASYYLMAVSIKYTKLMMGYYQDLFKQLGM